jgi:glyoxylase-like metal-dependent hydrolase (beta-lactamase superfamily II)
MQRGCDVTQLDNLTEVVPGVFMAEQGGASADVMLTGNSYIVVSDGGLFFIDPGMHQPETADMYKKIIRYLGKDPEAILLTHAHGDHGGIAGFLEKEYGTKILVHKRDRAMAFTGAYIDIDHLDETRKSLSIRWKALGLGAKDLGFFLKNLLGFAAMHHAPSNVDIFVENQLFRWDVLNLKVIHAPGHSPGSCCFYDPERKILFSGDTLLPAHLRTPLMGTLFGVTEGTIDVYLSSLETLKALEVDMVLPGHARLFRDYSERIQEVFTYYEKLSQRVVEAVSQKTSASAAELADILTPGLIHFEKFMMVGEVADVLSALAQKGAVKCLERHGVTRWSTT